MRLILLVIALWGCGGLNAEAPLTVPLGITHGKTESELHAHQFCRESGQVDTPKEVFPRCDRTASEVSEAWVTAIFDGDKLVELRRWERFPDDARAVERWNELVAARAKVSAPSDVPQLKDKGLVQSGTRAVKAFTSGDTVIGVYLLTPSEPENANVLEKVSYAK
jgi:hypothetical protein